MISNATVGLYSATGNWETQSDERGRFEFKTVPGGNYELQAQSPGFRPQLMRSLQIANSDPAEIILKLIVGSCPPCCDWYTQSSNDNQENACGSGTSTRYVNSDRGDKSLMRGVVSIECEENALLKNASVVITKMGERAGLTTTQTDAAGEFEFADLEPGRYALRVSQSGYQERSVANVRVKYGKVATPSIPLLRSGTSYATVMSCLEIKSK